MFPMEVGQKMADEVKKRFNGLSEYFTEEIRSAMQHGYDLGRKDQKPSDVNLANLIECVQEQGCVKLKDGSEGIPREIKISPEYTIIEVSTVEGRGDYEIDEIEEIIHLG